MSRTVQSMIQEFVMNHHNNCVNEIENEDTINENSDDDMTQNNHQDIDEDSDGEYNEETDDYDGDDIDEDDDDDIDEDDDDDIDDDDNENLDADLPLYTGANLTITHSMLLIFTILIKHSVSLACLEDIIQIINLHCPDQNLYQNSLYKFKKFFSLDKNKRNMKKHFYCTLCNRELQSADHRCPSCRRKKNSYFVTMSIVKQIREMFKRNSFINNLQHRFQRIIDNNVISDIYDGSIYKYWSENGFLRDFKNISFSWYTDGIPVFKSSQVSMTPFFLTINELPFEIRKLRENTLLLGLWFGKTKPNPNLFMSKFKSQLSKMVRGINVKIPGQLDPILVKGIVIAGTADTPAKSDFLNFKKFNGAFGCMACCIEGLNVRTDNGSTHVYPYQEVLELRTSRDCIIWAQTATAENPVMGVKGPTALSIYMSDFIEGMAIDRMHGVDGGIIKKILTLLFDVQYKDEGFSLYDVIDTVNSRLMSIKTTKFIHRTTRTITEVTHWKASELRVWAYYYSLPVLEGILRQDLFENYKLLIGACAILSFNEITEDLLTVAEDFLRKFVKDFEELYGLRFCSINLHQLLHLPDCVRKLGPLWSTQCFEYENINGQTLGSINGTDHIDTQVESSHMRFIRQVRFTETLPEGKIKDFCLNRKKQAKIIERIGFKTYSIGTYKYLDERPNNLQELLRNANIDDNVKLYQYFRMLNNRKIIVSTMYPRELQTQSNAVCYSDRERTYLGFVDYFIKVTYCNCQELICLCNGHHYAIIQQILTDGVFEITGETHIFNTLGYLHKCHVEDAYFLVPVENVDDVCVVMNFDDKMYIGIPLNKYELE